MWLVLAADVLPQDVTGWVVGVVLTFITGALGFFLRSSLGKLESGIEGLGARLDALKDAIADGEGDRRELAAELRGLRDRIERTERELADLRRELREASEGGIVR